MGRVRPKGVRLRRGVAFGGCSLERRGLGGCELEVRLRVCGLGGRGLGGWACAVRPGGCGVGVRLGVERGLAEVFGFWECRLGGGMQS